MGVNSGPGTFDSYTDAGLAYFVGANGKQPTPYKRNRKQDQTMGANDWHLPFIDFACEVDAIRYEPERTTGWWVWKRKHRERLLVWLRDVGNFTGPHTVAEVVNKDAKAFSDLHPGDQIRVHCERPGRGSNRRIPHGPKYWTLPLVRVLRLKHGVTYFPTKLPNHPTETRSFL